MSNYWDLMLMYSDDELPIGEALKIEKTIDENKDIKKGFLLNRQINEFMRVKFMMEQINEDPRLNEILKSSKSDVIKSKKKSEKQKRGLSFFINGALLEIPEIENQINEAEREMFLKGIDEETSQWVQIWKKDVETLGENDKYTSEISDYIKQGMENIKIPLSSDYGKKGKRKLIYRISTVAAVLILALGIWNLFGTKPSNSELFAEYYKPYKVIDGQTRSYNHEDDKFVEIARLYKNGQYETVAIHLKEFIGNDANSPKILLIYGITQIEQHKYADAVASFNEIIEQDGEFSIEAKWYLALCYIKLNDAGKAKTLLTELSETPGLYKPMAIKLLDEL